jgi:hypothetical protein
MKSSFIAGVILGIVVALGLARFFPWVSHPRVASLTTVLHNGGRAENFVIRIPVDRIASSGSADMGLRATAFPAGVELPPELAGESVLVEHFKLRDADGDVIGIAARHASVADSEATTAWALTIPSRGTLRLTGASKPGLLDRELATAGRSAGSSWSGQLAMNMSTASDRSGRLFGGTSEFEGLVGSYSEDWLVTGVGQAGELRGTIRLHTTAELGE